MGSVRGLRAFLRASGAKHHQNELVADMTSMPRRQVWEARPVSVRARTGKRVQAAPGDGCPPQTSFSGSADQVVIWLLGAQQCTRSSRHVFWQ